MSYLIRCCIFQLPRNASTSQSRSYKILRATQLLSNSCSSQHTLRNLSPRRHFHQDSPIAMSTTDRPSTPPEKRVIHSQNPTSPPPETSAAKKLKMSSEEAPVASIDAATETPAEAPAVTSVETQPSLLIKKLNDKARTPTRGSAFAAGYDLYASEDTVVPKGGKALVETGLSMAIPEGCYGRVAPRSGLASKNFIDTGAGVIDSDYRGPLKILLFNHSDVDFEVKEGDRVAQLILERIYTPEILVVEDLEESARGAGGFGSSGR
ncbi:hypothetical protein ABW19_dt0201496 [Dactylella cylindrospora]|nr:hypothetical protein ABW19_dt0201496 [Dactylella cylindrospora]